MYCKYCGKQLSNNARFCDRCGHNVGRISQQGSSRQSSSGRSYPYGHEDLYSYEKNRSSGYSKYQKYKREQQRRAAEEKRRKIRNRRIVLLIILLAVAASVATGIGSYIYVKNHSDDAWKNTDGAAQVNATASVSPSVSPSPSQEPASATVGTSQSADGILSAAAANKCKIYTDKTMNFTFPYPESFVEASISGSKTKYSVKDPEGDGSMMISAETVGSSATAKQIMKDYASGVGTSLSFNRAGDNWYSLAFERNGKYNYRKGILLNGQHIYYDFIYETSSQKRSEYEGYTKYIDEYLSALLEKGSASPTSSAKSAKSSGTPKASASSSARATATASSDDTE